MESTLRRSQEISNTMQAGMHPYGIYLMGHISMFLVEVVNMEQLNRICYYFCDTEWRICLWQPPLRMRVIKLPPIEGHWLAILPYKGKRQ